MSESEKKDAGEYAAEGEVKVQEDGCYYDCCARVSQEMCVCVCDP